MSLSYYLTYTGASYVKFCVPTNLILKLLDTKRSVLAVGYGSDPTGRRGRFGLLVGLSVPCVRSGDKRLWPFSLRYSVALEIILSPRISYQCCHFPPFTVFLSTTDFTEMP